MTEKKGIVAKVKEKIIAPFLPHQPVYYEDQTLSAAGIRISSDGKLEQKQQDIDYTLSQMEEDYSEDPAKIVDQLEDRLMLLHKTITKHAAPYALGGDNTVGALMMYGWNRLYFVGLKWVVKARRYWLTDVDDEINKIHIHNMQIGILNWMFPDAFCVLAYVYHKPEVRERNITVLQPAMMNPMMGGGETLTSSGGRTSEDHMQHPDYTPVPRRVPNKP